jgi:putative ABC transport system permease protein
MMSSTSMRLSPDEQLPPAGAEPTVYHPSVHAVSRAYPRSLGMRVVRGTAFPAADDTSGRQGVLVNEALAYGRFPGADPVGRVVYFGTDPFEILGVVADVRQQGADVAAAPAVFVDIADWGLPPMGFVPNLHYLVRGSGTSAALSEAVRSVLTELDDEALLDNVAPMERLMTTSIARPRIYAWLFGTFAALAGLVAAIGIYGVMAYAVAQSTRDIGIRMALGAPRARVLGVVLGRAAALTGAGLTIGLALAWATTRYLRGILFGVTPLDPRTYAAVAIGFAAVAILASYVPARRATNVDPLVALRTE